MDLSAGEWLLHYGILRESGRYPWGSGENPEEHGKTFLGMVQDLQNQGLKEADIAKGLGMGSVNELRQVKSNARSAVKQGQVNMARNLRDKGWSHVAIGNRMNIPESTVRTLVKDGAADKAVILNATSDMLKSAVDEKKYIDIGSGVERHLAISTTKLSNAVRKLTDQGYEVHRIKVEQLGTGKFTNLKVLTVPGTGYAELMRNKGNIKQIMNYSDDGGRTWPNKILPPLSVDSKRVSIRYAEDGGTAADGVVYVRPGIKDLSLGENHYAQVRIAVDGTHYIKGMAMYKDDLPAGTDLLFNTNKSKSVGKLDVLKPFKKDPDSPFGALIDKQIGEFDSDGVKHLTSVMNIVNGEGDWEEWAPSLSTQFLSKQSLSLASKQLDITYDNKKTELEDILGHDNPAVRKKLLKGYADAADSSAVHLKAASLPRQGSHVILPIESLKDDEVYAPNFRPGERVVLIRYPHAGSFEIPELKVNNKNPDGRKLIGSNARDAIGINSKVAAKLSGADFDGDTVLVIPNNDGKIKHSPSLEGLKGFDPQHEFPYYDGMHVMTSHEKGTEMGKISNLITDMSIQGATDVELARAVRHSMVVIDAEKHQLDYHRSAIENGIPALKIKYQGRKDGGASTLLSRGSSDIKVDQRKMRIDENTGKKVYTYSGATYTKTTTSPKQGRVRTTEISVKEREKSQKLAETDDAHTLSSGSSIETIYADHSNRMKDLANQARLEMINTETTPRSPEAAKKYKQQVDDLDHELNLALWNSPLERQAQIIGNAIVEQKKKDNPDMEKDELKKLRNRELLAARDRVNAQSYKIDITPEQWEAIQAGAITNNKLTQILDNADLDKVKKLATPKERELVTGNKLNRALALLDNGYTQSEVADQLGVSLSTLKRSLREEAVNG